MLLHLSPLLSSLSLGLFSLSSSFENYANLYHAQPPCLITEFGVTIVISDKDYGITSGARSILGIAVLGLPRRKKKIGPQCGHVWLTSYPRPRGFSCLFAALVLSSYAEKNQENPL